MGKSIRVLDCTLREAPIDSLMWGETAINKVINGMADAGIEIIEVGFLKNELYCHGSTSFRRVEEIEKYIKKKPGLMYVALVDYGRYDLEYLSDYDGKSIDAIRICFKHREIDKVLEYANEVRAKGYGVCIQHVDTLGYSDDEIAKFIDKINLFKPFSYSIVDTFGAMYASDLKHYIDLVDSRLDSDIQLGFHSHNNILLADANVQLFIETLRNKRDIIVDTSLYGCGRGAGNAHTELTVQFLNKKLQSNYGVDEILDLLDTVITAVQQKTTWGYSIPYFISGMYNAHTFNVNQLMSRHNIKSKDLRGIIGMLDDVQKKEYDYALLEKLYIEYFDNSIDDSKTIKLIGERLREKDILLIGPGTSVTECKEHIQTFIDDYRPIVIGVNNCVEYFKVDYMFFSSSVRYDDWKKQSNLSSNRIASIITSNIKSQPDDLEYIVNYATLIKSGWINFDSSLILLLRLLIKCGVKKIHAAGLDGHKSFGKSFYKQDLDLNLDERARISLTNDNISMLKDIKDNNTDFDICFLTDSAYKEVFI